MNTDLNTDLNHTSVEYLEDENESIRTIIHEYNIDTIFDFSYPLHIRMDALNQQYTHNPENVTDIVKKLIAIYHMSPVNIVKKFVYELARHSDLPLQIKIECSIALIDIEGSVDLGLECLHELYGKTRFKSIPAPCQIQYMLFLVNDAKYRNEYKIKLAELLVVDTDKEEVWRYKMIMGLRTHLKNIDNDVEPYIMSLCFNFVVSTYTSCIYKIIGSQYLLSKYKDQIQIPIFELLFEMMRNKQLSHATRADAADVLLRYGTPEVINEAENVIAELGGQYKHIYDNLENVHVKQIDDSVKSTIQYLDTLNIQPIPTFETVKFNLQSLAKTHYRRRKQSFSHKKSIFFKRGLTSSGFDITYDVIQEDEPDTTIEEIKIQTSLCRIDLDKTVFDVINHSLSSILLTIYAYIQQHECRRQLERRLLEELVDMAGTCTTGFIGRLINVLSGFDDFNLSIGWEDQVAANLAGRLNARIKQHPDMESILEQLITNDMSVRPTFLKFFRENISSIREEMYDEFKPHMTDLEWDEYFQKAVLRYDC